MGRNGVCYIFDEGIWYGTSRRKQTTKQACETADSQCPELYTRHEHVRKTKVRYACSLTGAKCLRSYEERKEILTKLFVRRIGCFKEKELPTQEWKFDKAFSAVSAAPFCRHWDLCRPGLITKRLQWLPSVVVCWRLKRNLEQSDKSFLLDCRT